MKRYVWIGLLVLLALSACDSTTREARRMVERAEQLADTLPDSTVRLIDSVLRMPASFSERERMDMALLQAEALFGDHGQEISPVMDDDFFDEHATLSTSPELERAAAYYAGKKQYAKAAHAALYSGFVQQHYNEKEAAMRSFKEAEQYGKLAVDSLAVARAEYWMGKLLYDDYKSEEALSILKKADAHFGLHYRERAYVQNGEAIAFIVLKQFNKAEKSLEKSFDYAELGQDNKLKRKILNNYAVLRRLEGKNDEAIAYLKQIKDVPDLSGSEKALLYLNLGKAFMAQSHTDSAAFYFHHLEDLLPKDQVKNETKASSYGTLSHLAEIQGDTASAFQYLKKREDLMSMILANIEKNSVYRIQQQYDYESLQNEMNRKLIRRQYIITLFCILTIIGLAALAVSQIRLAKTRKQEAETNANLFHFMQQNKSLVESNMSQERKVLDATQQLSDMYFAKFKTMQKLSFSIENPKNKIALKELEKAVFGDGEHWDGVIDVLDVLYPGLWESITFKYPEMEEMERRVFILSRFKLSRMEEAALLGISTSVLDKLRTRVHKIVEQGKKQ